MRVSTAGLLAALTTTAFGFAIGVKEQGSYPIKPMVFIISMFDSEANVWYDNDNNDGSIGSLTAQTIPIPGFSPLFPDVHCTSDGTICQLTTGEAEINAATTMSALVYSGQFDLTTTYFMIAGIAGVNPKEGTTGSVAFSKYAVQVGLQYEFDAREMPENFTTGYFAQGTASPDEAPPPGDVYGTEVFELNEDLRDIAIVLATAGGANLQSSPDAQAYAQQYSPDSVNAYVDGGPGSDLPDAEKFYLQQLALQYTQAYQAPSVLACDVATSDQYFSGVKLCEMAENTTNTWTNQGGVYCMTAQEDNATLEVLLRAAMAKLVDSRESSLCVRHRISIVDSPVRVLSDNLFYVDQYAAFEDSIQNIYIAGVKVVQGIVNGWDSQFQAGIPPTNYIGDIFGSLGGTPDFGPGVAQEPIPYWKESWWW